MPKEGDKYIVVRNSIPTSEFEFDSIKEAEIELNRWKNIIKRWPDGSKLAIIPKPTR